MVTYSSKIVDIFDELHSKYGGYKKMKHKLLAFLLIMVITLSFAVPVMAKTQTVLPLTIAESTTMETEHSITPFIEQTRSYWRTYGGQLQFRIWGVTSARWLTDWIDV